MLTFVLTQTGETAEFLESVAAASQQGTSGGLLDGVGNFLQTQGLTATALIAVGFLFWHLVWRVWSSALQAKEDEIKRLVDERNRLQDFFFDRLKSSEPKLGDGQPSPSKLGED